MIDCEMVARLLLGLAALALLWGLRDRRPPDRPPDPQPEDARP